MKDHRQWLLIFNNNQILLYKYGLLYLIGFDYFDASIRIYLWRCLLTFVIGTASLTLVDGAKQAGLVGCSGTYLSKLHPVAIFSK